MSGLIAPPTFMLWPFSHLLALFEIIKAEKEGRNIRPKTQMAPAHSFELMALISNLISMIPMFAIAYYTNMVYPILDIIEEAMDDKG